MLPSGICVSPELCPTSLILCPRHQAMTIFMFPLIIQHSNDHLLSNLYSVYASASHLSISIITVMEKSLTTLEGSFEEITVKFCWKCLKSTLFFCWNCQLMQPKSGFLSQNKLSIMGHIQPKIHRPALGLLDPSPCLRQLFVVNKPH